MSKFRFLVKMSKQIRFLGQNWSKFVFLLSKFRFLCQNWKINLFFTIKIDKKFGFYVKISVFGQN